MQGVLRRVLALWVRATLRPEDAAARLAGRTVPVCYVLERRSPSDLAVLQNVCVRERLPRWGAILIVYSALVGAWGVWSRALRRSVSCRLGLVQPGSRRVRSAGTPVGADVIEPSALILPQPDATMAEVRKLLADDGLIPG